MRMRRVAAVLAAWSLGACTNSEMGAFADALAVANGGYYENYQDSKVFGCADGGRLIWTYGISGNMSFNYATNASGMMADVRFFDADGEVTSFTLAPGETTDTVWYSPSADSGNIEYACR